MDFNDGTLSKIDKSNADALGLKESTAKCLVLMQWTVDNVGLIASTANCLWLIASSADCLGFIALVLNGLRLIPTTLPRMESNDCICHLAGIDSNDCRLFGINGCNQLQSA